MRLPPSLLRPLVLCAPLLACGSNPPVPEPTPTAPPAIPSAGAAPTPDTLGWVRAHQISRMAERLGVDNPMQAAAAAGVDLSSLDPERPMVALAGAPPGGDPTRTPALAWLPVTSDSTLGVMLAAASAGGTFSLANGTGVALNGAARGTPEQGVLEALAISPMYADVEVFLAFQTLMRVWGEKIESGLSDFQREVAHLPGNGPKVQPAVIDAYVAWLRETLAGLGTLSIGFAVGTDDLSLSYVSRDKAALDTPWPTTAEDPPDLGRFVPPGAFRIELTTTPKSKWLDLTLKLYGELLKDQPAARERLEKSLRVWTTYKSQMAMSMSFGDPLFRFTGVTLTPGAEQLAAAMVDVARLMSEPAVVKAMTQGVIDFTIEVKEDARRVEDQPVTQLTYHMKKGPRLAEMGGAPMLDALVERPMTLEMVRLGQFVLFTLNEPPAALDRVAAEVMAGQGSQPSLVARSKEPKGGTSYFDFDLAAFGAGIVQMLPAEQRPAEPLMAPGTPPVVGFHYGADAQTYAHVSVPKAVVDQIRALGDRLRGLQAAR